MRLRLASMSLPLSTVPEVGRLFLQLHFFQEDDVVDSDGADRVGPLPTPTAEAFRRYRSAPSVTSRASSVDRCML